MSWEGEIPLHSYNISPGEMRRGRLPLVFSNPRNSPLVQKFIWTWTGTLINNLQLTFLLDLKC